MTTRLHIDLNKIRENTALVAGLLAPHGVRLVGVTKACLGDVRVAGAMLAGGAGALADSRVESLARLRETFPEAELHLTRSPVTGSAGALDAADLFFVSSEAQARALLSPRPAGAAPASLCLILETGDGREGVPLELAAQEAARVAALDGASLAGVATNAACARPGAPLGKAMERLAGCVRLLGEAAAVAQPDAAPGAPAARAFAVVSAGGSGLLPLFMTDGDIRYCVPRIGVGRGSGPMLPFEPGGGAGGGAGSDQNHGVPSFPFLTDLRCGEALLLGRIPSGAAAGTFLPGSHRDAFVLEAPVLEVFRKGGVRQALVGFGVQDVGHGPVIAREPGIRPVKITSDYLLVNYNDSQPESREITPGAVLSFLPTYYSLLAAMTSPFVEKVFRGAK